MSKVQTKKQLATGNGQLATFIAASLFALAFAALLTGRTDAGWTRQARPWALFSWAVLGAGILLGANWAYEELGWGGYWNWDPVETWSLITWLVYALYLHLRITFGWRGRKAAWFAAVAAVAVTITFGGMGFVGGIHTRLL